MSEPKRAYIASTLTVESIEANGYSGIFGRTKLHLSATNAIDEALSGMDLGPDESVILNIYEIDLSNLDGMWPRVSTSYNDYRLQWSCNFDGKIPARVLRLVNSLPVKGNPPNAETPPTNSADGENAGSD